jgi:hypothetical protein
MKREPDLTRLILFFIEDHSPPQGGLEMDLEIPGYDRPTVLAHTQLLIEDGLVFGHVMEGMSGIIHIEVTRLTSAGHDAIAAVRSDTWWEKSKHLVKDKGIALTFAALVQVAKTEASKLLGLP